MATIGAPGSCTVAVASAINVEPEASRVTFIVAVTRGVGTDATDPAAASTVALASNAPPCRSTACASTFAPSEDAGAFAARARRSTPVASKWTAARVSSLMVTFPFASSVPPPTDACATRYRSGSLPCVSACTVTGSVKEQAGHSWWSASGEQPGTSTVAATWPASYRASIDPATEPMVPFQCASAAMSVPVDAGTASEPANVPLRAGTPGTAVAATRARDRFTATLPGDTSTEAARSSTVASTSIGGVGRPRTTTCASATLGMCTRTPRPGDAGGAVLFGAANARAMRRAPESSASRFTSTSSAATSVRSIARSPPRASDANSCPVSRLALRPSNCSTVRPSGSCTVARTPLMPPAPR